MPHATGSFEITAMEEDAYHVGEGEARLARARGTQRFNGPMEADGHVEWLACYLPSGTARLIGLQQIEGSLDGRHGSFVIEARADHDGSTSRGSWTVLDGSGTGGLSRIRGTGRFEADGASLAYHLDYELD